MKTNVMWKQTRAGFGGLLAAITIVTAMLISIGTPPAAAQHHEALLYTFQGAPDGGHPNAGLIYDAAGNLYGTTFTGGTGACTARYGDGCGTVFELVRPEEGTWTEQILYNFQEHSSAGQFPYPTGLVFDHSGNLFGTTEGGGDEGCNCGTVFELSPVTGGAWTETVIFRFNSENGEYPEGGVMIGKGGHIYGTTEQGGAEAGGIAYELALQPGGEWAEKVLHAFGGGGDGSFPQDHLIQDEKGNLYGTTRFGGSYSCSGHAPGCGTAFELSPQSDGSWTEQILHNFQDDGIDGFYPAPDLTFDAAGNLYGTTAQGGGALLCSTDCGTAFELSPQVGGEWAESILHNFGMFPDGGRPTATVIFDKAGNLWGITYVKGQHGAGTVFELSPASGGGWTETVVQNIFQNNGVNGVFPDAPLTIDRSGRIFGTTLGGGAYNAGVVYSFEP